MMTSLGQSSFLVSKVGQHSVHDWCNGIAVEWLKCTGENLRWWARSIAFKEGSGYRMTQITERYGL